MGRIGQKIIHTRRILSLVWTRLVHRVDPFVAEIKARPRGAARVHSFIRARHSRNHSRDADASRRDASIRSDPIDSFVRIDSFASIRPLRILAQSSRAIASPDRRFAPRSVASSARIVDRGLVDRRISSLSFSRGRRRRVRARGVDGTCRFSFVYSFVRATRTRTRSTTTTTTRRRARATRSIDARDVEASEERRRGGGATARGCG